MRVVAAGLSNNDNNSDSAGIDTHCGAEARSRAETYKRGSQPGTCAEGPAGLRDPESAVTPTCVSSSWVIAGKTGSKV